MIIQLFNPPQFYFNGLQYRMNPPLGLPILSAVLREAGHEASVTDLEALGVTPDAFGRAIENQRGNWPDVIGFTCLTHNRRGVMDCIKAARSKGYYGYIIVGGPHMSIAAAEPIEWGADCAVVGECEGNIAEIVKQQPSGVVTGKREDMPLIPAPDWEHHTPRPRNYRGNEPHIASPEGIAMWSRGCPHNCTFCGNPVFWHTRIRYAPVVNIYHDMAALKEQGCRAVFVYDDELVGLNSEQSAWLAEVCREIAPLGLVWKAQGRCNEKTPPELYKAMYDAGCRVMMWGVESFCQPVLDAMRKGTTEADIWATLRAARKAGIANWLFLMVGNYTETKAELQYTEARLIEAAREGLVQYRQVTVCTPVRGTPLYEKARSEGWLVEPPDAGAQMNQVYACTPWLTEREIAYWQGRLRVCQ